MPVPKDRRIVAAVVLAALLVVLLVVVAIAQGIGDPSVPSDDVAVVEDAPDSHISTEEFDTALEQGAAAGQTKVPPPSSPEYAALRDSAMSSLLQARWVRGEAEELGITLSDSEIDNQLEQIKQQYGGEKGFQKALKQAHFTLQQARGQAELQLLGNRIEQEILPQDSPPDVSDSEIEDFYEANLAQFEQPETRDVRQIFNKDQAKVERAKSLLEQDDSAASWKKVAARFSTDPATKDGGGLLAGVVTGQSEPALEEQIFAAAEGQLIGPFEGQSGYYLIQVEKITPAETTPLAEVSEEIKQQLAQGKQQQVAQDAQLDFLEKWKSRTFCADGYVIDGCENFTPIPPQRIPGAPPVVSTPAVSPGQTTVFPGQPIPALPQGPIQPAAAQQPGIIGPPGGAVPPAAPPPAPPPGG